MRQPDPNPKPKPWWRHPMMWLVVGGSIVARQDNELLVHGAVNATLPVAIVVDSTSPAARRYQ